MPSLRLRVATSALWSTLQVGGNQLTSFIVFLALSRVVSAKEIGVVTLSTSFVEVVGPLVRGGIPEALIQREDASDLQADTCFWSTLGASLFMAAALFAAAPALAGLFDTPELTSVLRVLTLVLPLNALAATHEARLTRAFGFRALALRGLSARILGGALGVVMAFAGYGVWSLVAQRVLDSIVSLVITWRAFPWRPDLRFSRGEFHSLARFGLNMMATSFLSMWNARQVEFLLGYVLGPAAVGVMRVATRCLDLVTHLTTTPLTSLALPAFSRLQNDSAALERAFLKMTQVCGFVTFPAYFGLAVIAHDLVPVAFGPSWYASAELLPILCLMAVPATLQFFTWPALSAVGRSDRAALGVLVLTVLSAVFVLLAAPFGIVAVTAAVVCRTYVTLPFSLGLLRRFTAIRPQRALQAVLAPFLAAAVMAYAVFALQQLLGALSPVARIALSVCVGGVLYAAIVMSVARLQVNELLDMLRRRAVST